MFKNGAWYPITKVLKDSAWKSMKGLWYNGNWYEIVPVKLNTIQDYATSTKISTGGENIYGFQNVTSYGVRYRLPGDMFWSVGANITGTLSVNNFSVLIPTGSSILTPETTYEYQAWVEVSGTRYYGEIRTITTAASGNDPVDPPDTDPYLQTIPSETTWLIDKTASYYNFDIESNIDWKAEVVDPSPWLTFEVIQSGDDPIVIEGTNNRQITFGVTENNTGFNRYTTIMVYPINEPSLSPIQITVGQSIGSDASGAGSGGGGEAPLVKDEEYTP